MKEMNNRQTTVIEIYYILVTTFLLLDPFVTVETFNDITGSCKRLVESIVMLKK